MSEWLNNWLTYRASIPRENAERILALMKSGRLQVRRGASGFDYNDATGNFKMFLGAKQAVSVQYLISATGSASSIEQADSALIGNLMRRGLIRPHRFGGVDCRFEDGQVIPGGGEAAADSRMFAPGAADQRRVFLYHGSGDHPAPDPPADTGSGVHARRRMAGSAGNRGMGGRASNGSGPKARKRKQCPMTRGPICLSGLSPTTNWISSTSSNCTC